MLKASARVQGSDFSLILKFLGPRALICALASRCAFEVGQIAEFRGPGISLMDDLTFSIRSDVSRCRSDWNCHYGNFFAFFTVLQETGLAPRRMDDTRDLPHCSRPPFRAVRLRTVTFLTYAGTRKF